MEKYFCVNAGKYIGNKNFEVYAPASVEQPQDHSVMFLMERMKDRAEIFLDVKNCLVFWNEKIAVPELVEKENAIVRTADPRLEYCRFFRDNNIRNLPLKEHFQNIDGAMICDGAEIKKGTIVMPGCYIGGKVTIGESCYIGAGTRIVGRVYIGSNVIIRENTVIGADGLTTDRDADGSGITMPQFGGVVIEDNVEIGANVTIARGAIDNTILGRGCKIDNSSFISHNVKVGEDTFIVGESILFGSSRTGKRVFISGNATIRNKAAIGDDAFIGMGAVVTRDVACGMTVVGNPARKK